MVTYKKPREGRKKQPPVALLLSIDSEYHERSASDRLPELQFRTRDAVSLPVLQTSRRGWQIMAHRGRRHDDLVVHYRRGSNTPREKAILYTGSADTHRDARLIAGREDECAAHYQNTSCRLRLPDGMRRGMLTLVCALALLPMVLLISENAITQESRPGIEIAVKKTPAVEARKAFNPIIDAGEEYPQDKPSPSANSAEPEHSAAPPAKAPSTKAKAVPENRSKVETIALQTEDRQILPPVQGSLSDAFQLSNVTWSGAGQSDYAGELPARSTITAGPGTEKPGPVSLNAYYRENSRSNPGLKADAARRDSYVAVDMNSKMLKGALNTTAQLAYSSFDPHTEIGLDEDAKRSMKLGIQGKYGRMKYGTTYKSTGGEFDARKKDRNKLKKGRENWESWTSFGLGDFSVKTSYAQRESNIDNNPNRPHYTEDETRVSLSHTLSQWPYFGYSVSYGQGSRDTIKKNGREASGPMNRAGASLTYSSNTWTSTLGTYRLNLTDELAGGLDSDIDGYYLSGSYYPSANLHLSPSVNFSNEYYESDGSRTDRQSFSLSAARTFKNQQFNISAFGQYYKDRNNSWNLDTDGVYAETGIVWNLGQRSTLPSTVGLHLTYNAYTDNVYTDGNIQDVAAWLVFKLNEPNTLLNRAYQKPQPGTE